MKNRFDILVEIINSKMALTSCYMLLASLDYVLFTKFTFVLGTTSYQKDVLY